MIREEASLREAADLLVAAGVGRLPVVRRGATDQLVGILTRSDILAAHGHRRVEAERAERHLTVGRRRHERQ